MRAEERRSSHLSCIDYRQCLSCFQGLKATQACFEFRSATVLKSVFQIELSLWCSSVQRWLQEI